jgi:hypothetical protein
MHQIRLFTPRNAPQANSDAWIVVACSRYPMKANAGGMKSGGMLTVVHEGDLRLATKRYLRRREDGELPLGTAMT